jgi:hypothetical protein
LCRLLYFFPYFSLTFYLPFYLSLSPKTQEK